MTTKEKVLQLKKDNPTWGYSRIAGHVGCSKNTVRFHLVDGCRRQTTLRNQKRRERPSARFYRKIAQFCNCSHHRWYSDGRQPFQVVKTIPVPMVRARIGENPICYLTGDQIDLDKPESYSMDHVVPISRGGESTLENLGLCTKEANLAKGALTHEEFLQLCQKVLRHHGYDVRKGTFV